MKKNPGWQPEPTQEMLLKAVLLPPDKAVPIWRRWQAETKIENLDHASSRLLPMLYKNLQAAGIEDTKLIKYRSVYRHYWYKNSLFLHQLETLLEDFKLSGAGPPMLLKGLPLILNYYADPGLRPMSDMDMLVSVDDLPAIFTSMREHGWVANKQLPSRPTQLWIQAQRECHFQNRMGITIDLHWNLLEESSYNTARIETCFRRGREVSIGKSRALIPDATDLFYHVLAHATQWCGVNPLRWIPDVKMIIDRDHKEINWYRLIDQARQDHLSLRFKRALQYLSSSQLNACIPIPKDVRRLFLTCESTFWENVEFHFLSHRREILGDFPKVCFLGYRCSRDYLGWRKRWKMFFSFISHYWQVQNTSQLPRIIIHKLKKRIDAVIKEATSIRER